MIRFNSNFAKLSTAIVHVLNKTEMINLVGDLATPYQEHLTPTNKREEKEYKFRSEHHTAPTVN